MNKKQRVVFLVGVGIIILMGLIPPWYYRAVLPSGDHIAQFTVRADRDYGFLFDPPPTFDFLEDAQGHKKGFYPVLPCIDFSRLLLQWAVVAIATAAMIFILKDEKRAR